MRNSVSVGDGIYKTTDGGETWTNMGLPNSEHIARIVVDPTNGDVVYACVPGRLWSDSADRGSLQDDGRRQDLDPRSSRRSNLSTGCSTVVMDPKNPSQAVRGTMGLPPHRVGLPLRRAPVPNNLPAGDLMVSEDAGASWTSLKIKRQPAQGPVGPSGGGDRAVGPEHRLRLHRGDAQRAVAVGGRRQDLGRARPQPEHGVAALLLRQPDRRSDRTPTGSSRRDLSLIASEDGGKSFTSAVADSTHSDHHAVWIDPTNPKHVVTGNDGGLYISYDGANRWQKADNLPISQFYHVSVDDKDPYQVYGGLQDNSAWAGDSAYPGGITSGRWENLGGGDGFWAWADPAAPEDFAYVESQGGSAPAGEPAHPGRPRHPAEVRHDRKAAL